MANAIIPSIILRALPVLRHSFGIDHHYSEDIADSLDSDLAAMLRLNGRLYAVWSLILPHFDGHLPYDD